MSKAVKIPDTTQLDPFELVYWTLPMTLAWIIWRTRDAVQSQWELYDFHLGDLNRKADGSRPGSSLRSLHDLLLSTEDDEFDQSSVLVKGPAARDDLWNKLGSAKLTATGIKVQSGGREAIACTDWQDLRSFDPDRGWPLDAVGNGFRDQLKFKTVSVATKDVLDLWPPISDCSDKGAMTVTPAPPLAQEEGPRPPRIAASQIEPEFLQWRNGRQGDMPTEREDIDHMKQFGVSRARVRELRKKFGSRKRGEKKVADSGQIRR